MCVVCMALIDQDEILVCVQSTFVTNGLSWLQDSADRQNKNYPLIFQADSNVMVAANSQGTIKVLELV